MRQVFKWLIKLGLGYICKVYMCFCSCLPELVKPEFEHMSFSRYIDQKRTTDSHIIIIISQTLYYNHTYILINYSFIYSSLYKFSKYLPRANYSVTCWKYKGEDHSLLLRSTTTITIIIIFIASHCDYQPYLYINIIFRKVITHSKIISLQIN